MGFSKIKGELTSRIGRSVRFGLPGDVHEAGGEGGYGMIVDEVWADPEINKTPPRSRKDNNDRGGLLFLFPNFGNE